MCPPKPKTPPPPAPPPAAPPPPSETATGIAPGNSSELSVSSKKKGVGALRVDLNVPGNGSTGLGVPT